MHPLWVALEDVGIAVGSVVSIVTAIRTAIAIVRWGRAIVELLGGVTRELSALRHGLASVRRVQVDHGRRLRRLETTGRP